MQPNIRALLVGINRYTNIRSLNECLNDVAKMETLLKKYYPGIVIEQLTDTTADKPTKKNVVDYFERHLIGASNPGDIALFYFSGHGGQEKAAKAFWPGNPSHLLEVLVCADSNIDTSSNFLADKEMRYLIGRLAQKKVEAIILCDCCHAGENTRGAANKPEVVERLTGATPIEQRAWSEFIFANELSEAVFEKPTAIQELLPEGQQVQFAACESFESAVEVRGFGGIFTDALIKTIEKFKGRVSYYELHSHIRRYIQQGYKQRPLVYVVGDKNEVPTLRHREFLSNGIFNEPQKAGVFFSKEQRTWILDIGATMGVSKQWQGEDQLLQVFDQYGSVGSAKIDQVYGGFSTLLFEPYADIAAADEPYTAVLPSLLSRGLNLGLQGATADLQPLQQALMAEPQLQITDNAAADFWIWAQNNELFLSNPQENRPLAAQIPGYTADAAKKLLGQIHHLNKWNFLLKLQNPHTAITTEHFEIRLERNGEALHWQEGQTLTIPLRRANEEIRGISLYFKNRHHLPLYVAVMELGMLFGVSSWKKANNLVHYLEPGAELDLHGFGFRLEEFVVKFNLPAEKFYWQIIMSETRFEAEPYLQEELKAATFRGGNKGLVPKSPTAKILPLSDWRTCTIEVDFSNPNYQA